MSEPTEQPDDWVNQTEDNQKLAAKRAAATETPEPLKTNYKDPRKRYELAERMVWAKLPSWKKQIIIECKVSHKDDRVLTEYAHEIARLAESEDVVLSEIYPPVPHLSLDKKPLLTK